MRWLILLIGLTCWSCAPESDKEKSTTFYDINGLIDEQIILLDSISPSILKKAIIGGKEENTQFTPIDSADWSRELSIFKSADINRSMLIDSYNIITAVDNSATIYKSKYPEDTEVETLSVKFDKSTLKPLEIHAIMDNSNELFNSTRTLEMHFRKLHGKMMLSRYKTEGQQQMISKDSVTYLIEAEIIYP